MCSSRDRIKWISSNITAISQLHIKPLASNEMHRGRFWRDKIVHVTLEGKISKSKITSMDLQGIEKNLFFWKIKHKTTVI